MKIAEIVYRYDLKAGAERPHPADADAARRRLDEGSRAFASLLEKIGDGGTARRVIHVDAGDLGLLSDRGSAPKQRPFAAVLGCADARVPIELIFNEGPNDLFVVRVAGNALGDDVLGSLKYAIDHLAGSMKLLVVLGHSGCGAVSAAVDVFQNPAAYLSLASQHILRKLLDRLLAVVHASARRMATLFGPDVVTRPGYREALIETSIAMNAAFAAHTLQQQLASSGAHERRTVYGVYLLADRHIWTPGGEGADSTRPFCDPRESRRCSVDEDRP